MLQLDIQKDIHTAQGKLTLQVDTKIDSGELVTLFGHSGAGKTTLLRILAGLLAPDRGFIKMDDIVWFDSSNKINLSPQARNIGFMFQDYALFPNMTVEENIQFAQPIKEPSYVNHLLEMFGLLEFKKRKPNGLSGGQKQRVALARSLARKPALLLLDEPLSALDTEMRIALQDEISRAHKLLGATTLLVSHDLNEVFRLSTHVIRIEKGQVAVSGTPDEVFTDTSYSGKFQITGQVAAISQQGVVNIVTVVSGNNTIVKVIALDSDLTNIKEGDQVMVFTKAFNPIITKLG